VNPGRLVASQERYGNTLAGSIPIGLHELNRSGKLQRGQRILLTGGAPSWGAVLLAW
jgi:3-oxoacyl-[acyl-carrier-protein] synthase-3